VLGPIADSRKLPPSTRFVVTLASAKRTYRTKQFVEKLGLTPEQLVTLIHPQATISRSAMIGYGCVILAGVRINSRVRLGNSVLVEGTIPRGTGNVNIAGTMTASAKAFRIDHPLDPANKELWHLCIESPDMMNLYNGTAITDAAGYATITLPSYFEALNRDFRYQLTVIDEDDTTDAFIWAKVVRKIGKEASNQFTIRTARGNVEVSWMVTGIRQDAYANHARITPEVEKAVKGTYLNPEAFGVVEPEEATARAVGE
jgi:hypothetical protein